MNVPMKAPGSVEAGVVATLPGWLLVRGKGLCMVCMCVVKIKRISSIFAGVHFEMQMDKAPELKSLRGQYKKRIQTCTPTRQANNNSCNV